MVNYAQNEQFPMKSVQKEQWPVNPRYERKYGRG